MNKLKLSAEFLSKEEIIKAINSHRLASKNRWYQVELDYVPFVYKIKAYNTWIQIMYKCEGKYTVAMTPSDMDISVTQFKNHLKEYIS